MDDKLFKILCEQVEAVKELTVKIERDPSTIGAGSSLMIAPAIQKVTFDSNGMASLPRNDARQGLIMVNETPDSIYGAFDENDATENYYTIKINSAGTEYYIPANGAYSGPISFKALDTSGYLMVTELTYQNRL